MPMFLGWIAYTILVLQGAAAKSILGLVSAGPITLRKCCRVIPKTIEYACIARPSSHTPWGRSLLCCWSKFTGGGCLLFSKLLGDPTECLTVGCWHQDPMALGPAQPFRIGSCPKQNQSVGAIVFSAKRPNNVNFLNL
jgi:hypothetical protein